MNLAKAEEAARAWMKYYGLTGWTFGFNTRKRSLGVCKYPRGGGPGRVVSNSINRGPKPPNPTTYSTQSNTNAHMLSSGRATVMMKCGRRCAVRSAAPLPLVPTKTSLARLTKRVLSSSLSVVRAKRLVGHFCKKCGPDFGKIVWQPMTATGEVVRTPRTLAEMGLDKSEIAALNTYARENGKGWREKIIEQWADETCSDVILGLDDKIRPYLNSINFRFHMEAS
jgi:hypothetical protein